MSLTQYIGARYVPKFFNNELDTPEWRSNVTYEPLTIVTYLNSSYTSKKIVPANIGNPANNPEYWACTGATNAQIVQLQNDVLDLIDHLNGQIRVIKSSFDTTLANGKVSKIVSGASFEALGIIPETSFVLGYSAYNSDSQTFWSNDSYPADYVRINTISDTVSVNALAPGAFDEKQIAGVTGKTVVGVTVVWSNSTVLNPSYCVKGDKVYVNIENIYSSAVTDTGTVTVYYEDAQADELIKNNQIPCISAKIRYDNNNKPYLQIESVLPSQYAIGDEFRIAIYTCDNVLNF